MRIAVITADDFLWCKISLALKKDGHTAERTDGKSRDAYDVCIIDTDRAEAEPVSADRVISVTLQ